ncbi:DUF4383 domain-containing protein [Aeromicrobium terrae]|uniref:DUF4383 domain-containing protein n=1 Tax=Aeromicrobium terrae TaxID=2498846 RepID=A0A5C8NJG4_9ACTN|nr:DUF4383 domain-containing protein [Aeromicrobium terrae]TXL61362.1 DUF4383 domain-containing protein [Aeromicrobium terrae]
MSSTASDSQAEKLARSAAAAVGVVFLLVGVLGLIPGITTDYDTMTFASHDSEAQLLGIFQVSILHNIVHILFGIAGLVAARNARDVPTFLFGAAAVYAVLTVYGIVIDKTSDANFVPLDSADNWLHLVLTVALAGLGLVVRRRLAAPASTR